MFYARRKSLPQPAVLFADKTPEQQAEYLARLEERERGRRARWEECNPLRKFHIVFLNGEERTVLAHHANGADSNDNSGRINFYRKRYGLKSPYRPDFDLAEVVFWTSAYLVRFVEIVEE